VAGEGVAGRSAAILFPSDLGRYGNDYFQDVLPLRDAAGTLTGTALIPFPPLPGVVLLPFVAIFGLATSQPAVAVAFGALNVGLCWRMLLRVSDRRDAAFLGAIFYGFGTVAWYAAQLGSTWFFAHVIASTFLFLGITAALDGDRWERLGHVAREVGGWVVIRRCGPDCCSAWPRWLACRPSSRHLSCSWAPAARSGDARCRRASVRSSRLVLLGYNVPPPATCSTAYDSYRNEYRLGRRVLERRLAHRGSALHPPERGHRAVVAAADPARHGPACADQPNQEGLTSCSTRTACPSAPDKLGMSILLTSPAYLLAIPALAYWRRRMVAGAALAILAIALVNLSHFSRAGSSSATAFSNDFAPLAMILVTLGIARAMRSNGWRALAVMLIGASVLINAWE
jgi:hypothetical protein